MPPLRIAVTGIGGFGAAHLAAVAKCQEQGRMQLVAIMVRNPAKYQAKVDELMAQGVRLYTDYDEMLKGGELDAVSIATPLHLHLEMTEKALEAGLHVLCEKTAAVTVQEVDAMARAQQRTGKVLEIGFQTLTDGPLRALEDAIIEGRLGEVREVVSVCKGLRFDSYYERAAWAGKTRLNDSIVLDGPVNNPNAHYLYNALYLAGQQKGEIVPARSVRAEMYHTRDIEGEDTACIEVEAENGVRVCYYTTLACADTEPYTIEVVGTEGRAVWCVAGTLTFYDREGNEIEKPEFDRGDRFDCAKQFANFEEHVRGQSDFLYSPITESQKFVRVTNAAYESAGQIRSVPADFVEHRERDGQTFTSLRDLASAIDTAAAQRKMFSDLRLPWATPTEAFDLPDDYAQFPQRFQF